jgi:hypothetical protein
MICTKAIALVASDLSNFLNIYCFCLLYTQTVVPVVAVAAVVDDLYKRIVVANDLYKNGRRRR